MISEAEYEQLCRNLASSGKPARKKPAKQHKHFAVPVRFNGHHFPSTWEAECYAKRLWEFRAGAITEPLVHVRFYLGVHYGVGRYYEADLVFVDLASGQLVVADAKGQVLKTYRDKKRTFEQVYNMTITEYFRPHRKRRTRT
jgi:hypothetical protein